MGTSASQGKKKPSFCNLSLYLQENWQRWTTNTEQFANLPRLSNIFHDESR
jgi:hypothetical protein